MQLLAAIQGDEDVAGCTETDVGNCSGVDGAIAPRNQVQRSADKTEIVEMKPISIIIFLESILTGINEYSNCFNAYMNRDEDLADYVLRVINESGSTHNEVEQRAKRKGLQISQGYISKIISRAATNISVEKLRALAAGLNRPEEEVFAVARGQAPDASKVNDAMMSALAFNYGKLTKKDKEAIGPLLRALQREIEERLEKTNRE